MLLTHFLADFSLEKLSFLSLRSLFPLEVASRFRDDAEEVTDVEEVESEV